jgi:hypothetical protein
MSRKPIYRVIFQNQGRVFEIYARSVQQGSLFGFIEIEKIVFGEKTSLVVDPSEESLKSEFENVHRTYVPMHAVIRIDEVSRQGMAKITALSGSETKVTPFPVYTRGGEDSRK